MINYLVFGPPGSGKGTFSQHLKEIHGYQHVSSGDLVRQVIKEKTPLGLEIEAVVRDGQLISDKIMNALIEDKLTYFAKNGSPFVIDGFGRTEESMNFLITLLARLNLSARIRTIYLESRDELCIQRILSRRLCQECGYIFNTKSAPPQLENDCDVCHGPLEKRLNDDEEHTTKRLSLYRSTVAKVYEIASKHFSSVRLSTEKSLEECIKNYNLLVGYSCL